MNLHTKHNYFATFILVIGAVLAGGNGISAKIALRELGPLMVTFVRLSLMACVLLPFSWNNYTVVLRNWKIILWITLLWCGNVFLFVFGIKNSTVIISSLLYTATPIFILMESYLIGKEKLLIPQLVGVVIAMLGVIFVVILPHSDHVSMGSWRGNLMVFLAVICYAYYLKEVKTHANVINTRTLATVMSCMGACIALTALIITGEINGMVNLIYINIDTIVALLYYSIPGGALMWLVFTWASRNASPFVSSNSNYISLVSATLFGVLFLGEKMSFELVIGGLLMIVGIIICLSNFKLPAR